MEQKSIESHHAYIPKSHPLHQEILVGCPKGTYAIIDMGEGYCIIFSNGNGQKIKGVPFKVESNKIITHYQFSRFEDNSISDLLQRISQVYSLDFTKTLAEVIQADEKLALRLVEKKSPKLLELIDCIKKDMQHCAKYKRTEFEAPFEDALRELEKMNHIDDKLSVIAICKMIEEVLNADPIPTRSLEVVYIPDQKSRNIDYRYDQLVDSFKFEAFLPAVRQFFLDNKLLTDRNGEGLTKLIYTGVEAFKRLF